MQPNDNLKKSFSHNYTITETIYTSEENGTEFYRAFDTTCRRAVGIKRITIRDRRHKKNVQDEINVLIKLEDKTRNVPVVYDYELNDKEAFIVMSYISGSTLSKLIEMNRGRERDAEVTRKNLSRLLKLAEVLGDIHALSGAQHKDLKPDNIIIKQKRTEEEVYLIDFGLTAVANIRGTGTVSYQAPEQNMRYINGSVRQDYIDVFAFGIIAVELLTGKRPEFGAELQLDDSGRRWRSLPELDNPQVPKAVKDVIYKCLSYDPVQRYRNGGDLKWQLKRALPRQNRPQGQRQSQS